MHSPKSVLCLTASFALATAAAAATTAPAAAVTAAVAASVEAAPAEEGQAGAAKPTAPQQAPRKPAPAKAEEFEARLTPLPVDTVTVKTTTGQGTVHATLEDNTLVVSGQFEGLNSPVTVAHIHRAPKGLRGPSLFDLIVTKSELGIVEGVVKLTPAQAEDLRKEQYYIQLHSELNNEGHLRGWLLKPQHR